MKDEKILFEIFPWNENFNTGIELVDQQHKILVDILNRLAVSLANLSGPSILNGIFDELADYAVYHFESEEKIWDEYLKDDEWARNHKDTHSDFIGDVLKIKENPENKDLDDVVYEVVSYLSKWLAYHILETDTRLSIAVREIKSGVAIKDAKLIALEEMRGSLRVIIDAVLGMYDSLSGRTLDLMREKALRKKAEDQLKLSEERWKFILDGASNNVWDWNIEDSVIEKSNNAVSIFEVINSADTAKTLIHPSDIEEMKRDYQDHLDGKTEFYSNKHRVLKENGSWSWVLSRGKVVSRDVDGNALRMVGTHTDITEQEFAALIYENSSHAIIITDAHNKIISVNPAYTKITGYTKDEATGKNPNIVASKVESPELYDAMWNSLNTTGYWKGEIYNKRKNAEIYLSYLEITVVTDSNGEIDHYFGISTDISQEDKYKKELEIQEAYLLHQSRMAQMGELISMIAHQWRQPLNAISLTITNLSLKCMIDEMDRELFEKELSRMDEFTQHLSHTIDDFRSFFKKDKNRDITTLKEIVNSTLSIVNLTMKDKNIELISNNVTCTHPLETYSNEVKQVILNLLKNSEDVLLERKIQNPKITIETVEEESCQVLIIKDNAGGIDEDVINMIFDPYFSTKKEKDGTGLGLYMSKTIIEDHCKGKLSVYNDTEGAVFKINFKIEDETDEG